MATAFETEMGVMPELSQAVQEMDWILPTDIQSDAVPPILGGRDVLMAAETGSGKTGAFCLPILQIVYETIKELEEGKSRGKNSADRDLVSHQWKMNVYDRGDAMAIDGMLCQSRGQGWHGTRANKGVQGRGRYYFEATMTDEGLCRVGWATLQASLDLGANSESFGYGGTAKKSHKKQFDEYGETFALNDTIGCFLDLDNMAIWWSKNGVQFKDGFTLETRFQSSAFYPAILLKNAELKLNFGETPLQHIPKGWTPICAAPKDCVVQSARTNVSCLVKSGPAPNAPMSIIIEPSRELAEQTYQQLVKFKKYMKNPCPRSLLLIGGSNTRQQTEALRDGVDIVVATPGRLGDMISTKTLSLANCRFFVLDECDALLSQGHSELINQIYNDIPKVTNDGRRLQMIICSATLHSFDVKKLAEKLLHFPTWIDLKGQDTVPETVHHVVCPVNPSSDTHWKAIWNSQKAIITDGVHNMDNLKIHNEGPELLSEAVKLLKGDYVIRAIREHKMDRAIIFCRTKVDCDNLEQHFIAHGGGPHCKSEFSCVCLHSDRNPKERSENLARFKRCDVRFLICTDVAARGIDVKELPYVINVTLPDEKETYVHRIGRVGRAERMGLAISLVATVKEKVWYHSNCNRNRNCVNTNLTTKGGCCIWYNEPQYLANIEEHLGVTIDIIEPTMRVPLNTFDGRVVYGEKLKQSGSGYRGHVDILAPTVRQLAELEKQAQCSYLHLKYGHEFTD